MKIQEGYGVVDPLEQDSPLTEYDYEFLKGNEVFWPAWGAAFGVVAEWCRNKGYGDFSRPTEKGKKAILKYEEEEAARLKDFRLNVW